MSDNNVVTSTQAANLLGLSRERMSKLLLAGRVKGAYRIGMNRGIWLVPIDDETHKPVILPPGSGRVEVDSTG